MNDYLPADEGPFSYMQGVSNIITDVVYIVAPILYLSTVQLSPRTQWGLWFVFCLGLMYVQNLPLRSQHMANLGQCYYMLNLQNRGTPLSP